MGPMRGQMLLMHTSCSAQLLPRWTLRQQAVEQLCEICASSTRTSVKGGQGVDASRHPCSIVFAGPHSCMLCGIGMGVVK